MFSKPTNETLSKKESPVNWTLLKLLIFGIIRGNSKVPKEEIDTVSENERKNNPACGAKKLTNIAHPVFSDMAATVTATTQIHHTLILAQTFTCCFLKNYFDKENLDTSIQREQVIV